MYYKSPMSVYSDWKQAKYLTGQPKYTYILWNSENVSTSKLSTNGLTYEDFDLVFILVKP